MSSISAVIITYNEEQNIGRCIRSLLQVADEIIVLDSFSTDKTVEIARGYGAIVYQEKFRGYIAQKNLAISMAAHKYILSLDADEALDPVLVNSIMEEKQGFPHHAYIMNRCTNFCGKFIRHGRWYPDRKIRLFDRSIAYWGGLNPHDKIQLQDGIVPKRLRGDILHYSFNSIEDLVWQNNRLSSIAASSKFANGEKSNPWKLFIHPAWAFLNGYILRRGFLDGIAGFSIAVHTAHYVFQKYGKLYQLQRTKKKKVVPMANAQNQPRATLTIGER